MQYSYKNKFNTIFLLLPRRIFLGIFYKAVLVLKRNAGPNLSRICQAVRHTLLCCGGWISLPVLTVGCWGHRDLFGNGPHYKPHLHNTVKVYDIIHPCHWRALQSQHDDIHYSSREGNPSPVWFTVFSVYLHIWRTSAARKWQNNRIPMNENNHINQNNEVKTKQTLQSVTTTRKMFQITMCAVGGNLWQ